MPYSKIKLERDGALAILTLDDPDTLNAMSSELLAEFQTALNQVADPADGSRCLVLTGAGRGFCSGANLSGDTMNGPDGKPDVGHQLEVQYHPVLRRLRNLNIPLVTAVNGVAAGAGMSFALMGDIIVAKKSAYFLQAFTKIGLVPDAGSTWMMPRLIGLARAKELSLLAEKLPADQALDWGLINRVFEDDTFWDQTLELANKLANGPTVAYGLTRRLYAETEENSYEAQLNRERWSQKAAGNAEDFAEGVSAFLEKRPAKFQGK